MHEPTEEKRILIVAVNWLGDLIFMTPAIRAIRKNFPNAIISCLVPPRGLDLLSSNPHLNNVIPLEENRGLWGILRWPSLIRFLKAQRFDTVFLFHRSFSRTFLAWAAGIPCRVGFWTWKRGWLLTQKINPPPKDSLHKAAYYLRVVEGAGLQADGLRYDVGLLPRDHTKVEKLLTEWDVRASEPLAALHVGANWHLKRWPMENFAQLADRLQRECHFKVILIGDQEDGPLVRGVQEKMRTRPLIACGRTSFRELGALLARTRILVTNDSGPLHLSVAVGTPVVAIFGPTDPKLSGPPPEARAVTLFGSIGCPVPCFELRCPVNLCMEQVSVSQVFQAVKQLVG